MVSSEGGEFGRSGSTDTDLSVSNWFVSEGVLGQEMSDHVCFDFNLVPIFSTVAVNGRSAHLWHDDGISKMSFDTFIFLSENGMFLLEVDFFLESIIFSMDSVSESSLLSGFHKIDNLFFAHIEEFLKFNTSVDLLSKWLLLYDLL